MKTRTKWHQNKMNSVGVVFFFKKGVGVVGVTLTLKKHTPQNTQKNEARSKFKKVFKRIRKGE